jgi:uncharacterized membrane protein YgcG
MINTHNTAILNGQLPSLTPLTINRTVFYTGYLISPQDTERFTALTKHTTDRDYRTLANNILITPRPAPTSILNKVGGLGHRMTWKVSATSHFDNKLWAARVEPVDPRARFYSENPTPTVVISLRTNARPIDAKYISNWVPTTPEQSFTFDTVVGEKVLLRIEREGQDDWQQSNNNSRSQQHQQNRKPQSQYQTRDQDFPPLASSTTSQQQSSNLDPNALQFAPPPSQQNIPTGPGNGNSNRHNNYTGHNNRGGGISKPGSNNNRGGNGRGGRGGGRGGGSNRFNNGGRGGGGGGGGASGNGRGGRGKGGGNNYRSLDDRQENYGGGGMQY